MTGQGPMDAFILQILNGLDKGSAYALIALGLTLIFGTLGVVNFAHGALFMIGAFCAVTVQKILSLSYEVVDPTQTDFLGNPLKVATPYVEGGFGPTMGAAIQDWSVPLAILVVIPVMFLVGWVMYTPILSPHYNIGMDFLVLSFVVVVVGGMGSLPGAVLAGFMLGILQSFASMNEVKAIIPGIDQIIIYLVAIIILLTRPRGLMGRRGVMEE